MRRINGEILAHPFGKFGFSVLVLLTLAMNAAAERLPLKIYSTADGLANDTVNRIVADSRGFLWFCTAEGLSRFDGDSFKNYGQNDGLPHRNTHDILETPEGRYLIATSGGLVSMNPAGRRFRWNILDLKLERTSTDAALFTTYPAPESMTDRKASKAFVSLAKDRAGNVFAMSGSNVYKVFPDGDGLRFEKLEFDPQTSRDGNLNKIFVDSRDNLWIAGTFGLFLRTPAGVIGRIDAVGGNGFFEDRDGNIWADSGGEPLGIRRFSFPADPSKPVPAELLTTKEGLLKNGFSNAIAELADGRILVSSDGRVFDFNPKDAAGARFRPLDDELFLGAKDKNGNIWFTTNGKGVARYSPNSFIVFDERDGLPKETITSIFGTPGGDVYATVGRTKLALVSGEKIESFTPSRLTSREWLETYLDFESASGDFFVPSIDGLMRYSSPRASSPAKVYTTADGLKKNAVTSSFEDSHGRIWFGVADTEISLHQLDLKTGRITQFGPRDGLPQNSGPVAYGEDSDGNVWIGFYFGQILRYKDGRFRDFTEEGLIARNSVSGFLSDSPGRLWISTTSRGLFRVDEATSDRPNFVNISTAQGLSSNQTNCLAKDVFGRIYIGTGLGINRLEPATGRVKIYTKNDGLPGSTISQCYSDAGQRLWFASNDSLISYMPTVENASAPPPIFLDRISVSGKPRPVSELGESEIAGLELAPDENQIRMEFFAISFDVGETLRYQYKLNDQEWSEPHDQRSVDLNLAAGTYEFQVQAITADGVISQSPARVAFTIARPVWQREWFLVLAAVVVGLLIFLIYHRRTENLRRINSALTEARDAEERLRRAREERLAELQKVRSRIATDLHDDIGSSLTQIAVYSEVARQRERDQGNAGEALDMISTVTTDLVETMSDIVWAINPKKDHLQDLTQRMRRFASDVLTATSIDLDFRALAGETEIPLGANIRREVFLIFKETVNNIVKHSAATAAQIEFETDEHRLSIRFTDNGVGFDPQAKIGDGETRDWKKMRGGNGLLNMAKRARELGGCYEIRSSVGGGTVVVLEVPLESSEKAVSV